MELEKAIRESISLAEGRNQLAAELEKVYTLFFYTAEGILQKHKTDLQDQEIAQIKKRDCATSLKYKPRGESFSFFIKKIGYGYDYSHTLYKISIIPQLKKGKRAGLDIEIQGTTPKKLMEWYGKNLTGKEDYHTSRLSEYLELPQQLLEIVKSKVKGFEKDALQAILDNSETKLIELSEPVSFYIKGDERFKLIMEVLSEGQKKELLKKIYEVKDGNKEFDSWLSEKYPNLVTEVGRDRAYLQ